MSREYTIRQKSHSRRRCASRRSWQHRRWSAVSIGVADTQHSWRTALAMARTGDPGSDRRARGHLTAAKFFLPWRRENPEIIFRVNKP